MTSERDEQFAQYVASRLPALRRTAFLLAGDRAGAEDLLQTALLKVYLAWPRILRREAVDDYVRTTLVRTRISAWRRGTWRESAVADLGRLSDGGLDRADGTAHTHHAAHVAQADHADHADRVVEREAVWQLLSELGPRQRAVLVLRFYEDLSEVQIARTLGCSVGTVKSQLSRGLVRLRQRLAAQAALDLIRAIDQGKGDRR